MKDFLGQELAVGDVVVFPSPSDGMMLARIERLSTFQFEAVPLKSRSHRLAKLVHCYGEQAVKLNSNDVTMYLLARPNEE
jgi:hypothetical protein